MLNSGEKKIVLCATKKINILTLVLSEKNFLNETKNHNPPPCKLNGRSLTSYWFDVLREITNYWFDVQKRANFKQLFCATCRFPQLFDLRAVCRGNSELFLVPWNKP